MHCTRWVLGDSGIFQDMTANTASCMRIQSAHSHGVKPWGSCKKGCKNEGMSVPGSVTVDHTWCQQNETRGNAQFWSQTQQLYGSDKLQREHMRQSMSHGRGRQHVLRVKLACEGGREREGVQGKAEAGKLRHLHFAQFHQFPAYAFCKGLD